MLPDKASEFALIEKFRQAVSNDPSVILGIGDDCAALKSGDRDWLVAADMLLEGVHFEWPSATPYDVGRKALGVNLSDIAAMAGTPRYAVVSLALPQSAPSSLATELFDGLNSMGNEFGVVTVGGDTNSWNGPLIINVTIIGETHEQGTVTRSGAKIGDAIFVTGELGGSLLGKHLNPQPRINEAKRLQSEIGLHSMLDISDGLVADLYHILEESHVGAVLVADQIPISEAAHQMQRESQTGAKSALDRALSDGEDFELLFTVGQDRAKKVRSLDLGVKFTEIGHVTENQSCQLKIGDSLTELARAGYCHAIAEQPNRKTE
jgi:thiamine-monophosphate kinase